MTILYVLYLVGVSAFAVSGVLAAKRANMDPFGAIVLAYLAGLAGGTTRDLILDRRPLYWTHDWSCSPSSWPWRWWRSCTCAIGMYRSGSCSPWTRLA